MTQETETIENNKLRIDVQYPENSPQGYGVAYLQSGSMPIDEGIGIGLAVLFAPLGAIQQKADSETVDELIAHAEKTFASYKSFAQSQNQISAAQAKCSDQDVPKNPVYADDDEEL